MQPKRTLERPGLVSGLLVLATLAVYVPVIHLGFINYDDPLYVTGNHEVRAGMTWTGLRWAFTHVHAANWHPLAWLSHMLDCELYGLNPPGHHVTNVLFHAANSVVLFLWLRSLTGAFWRSTLVAGLFALHPLHVESVAWVAERKDVLCAFFGLLSLWAYTRYAQTAGGAREAGSFGSRSPGSGRSSWRSLTHRPGFSLYVLSLGLFALGLLSKPMLVTWPCVMLLLDYWPLRRFQDPRQGPKPSGIKSKAPASPATRGVAFPAQFLSIRNAILEKLPFFALSAASSMVTLLAQKSGGAIATIEALPLGSRILNALEAYFCYLGKIVWPSDLAVIYPLPTSRSAGELALALGFLISATLFVAWQRRRRPYLPVGWAWFLGTLVPVIGLVQVGSQVMADRYTYLPAVGLFLVVAWTAGEIPKMFPPLRWATVAGAAVALSACALAAGSQLLYWQNSETLFRHALAVTKNNCVAYTNLGFFLAEQRQLRQAEACYRAAVTINPSFEAAWRNLGCALVEMRRNEEAIQVYETALRTDPTLTGLRNNLASALAAAGQLEAAKAQCREAARLAPRSAEPHSNLGALLAREGRWDEAVAEFERAVELDPEISEARCGLGGALAEQGKYGEAVAALSKLVKLQPANLPARLQLAGVLVKQGNFDQAIQEYSRLLRENPNDAAAHYRLALALERQGKNQEAILHYRAAIQTFGGFAEALNNLAWMLATSPSPQIRNGPEAVELAERACRATDYKQARMVGTLGAAYAEAGRFPEAIAMAEKAKALAESAGDTETATRNKDLLELYRSGKSYRDTP